MVAIGPWKSWNLAKCPGMSWNVLECPEILTIFIDCPGIALEFSSTLTSNIFLLHTIIFDLLQSPLVFKGKESNLSGSFWGI